MPSPEPSKRRTRARRRTEAAILRREMDEINRLMNEKKISEREAAERLLYLLTDRPLRVGEKIKRDYKSSRIKKVDPEKWPVEDRTRRTRRVKRGRKIAA